MVERHIGKTPQWTIVNEAYARAIKDRRKDAFKESMLQAFHLEKDSELELAALVISRMRGVSFEYKRNTFVYWMWSNDLNSSARYGLSREDVKKSLEAKKGSQLLSVMDEIVVSVIDSYRKTGHVQLPVRYDVKTIHRKALVEKYLGVVEDGNALGYKQIAALMADQLGERVTLQNVNHIVRLLREEGKAERRFLSKEQVIVLKGKVKELRNNTEESVQAIAGIVGQSQKRVEYIISSLVRDKEIANKNPRTLDDTRNLLLKIFTEHRQRFPGKLINLTAVARELGVSRRVVTSHYHKYAAEHEVPPISTVSWRTPKDIVYRDLVGDASKP